MPKWIRALPYQRMMLLVGLFAALNFMDFGRIAGGDIFRDGKIRYLFLLCAPLAFVYLRTHLTFAPAFFAALAIVSFTLHDFLFHAAMPLLMVLATMIGAVAVVKLGKEKLAELLIWSGTLQASFALAQYFFGFHFFFRPVKLEHVHIPVGLYGHETILGPFLIACLPPALWGRRWLPAGMIALAAALGMSSMTLAGLGAVLVVYVWHRWGVRAAGSLVGAGACLLGMLFIMAPKINLLNVNGRDVIWRYGWEAFLARPLFGSGIGAWAGEWLQVFSDRYAVELRTMPRQMHSDPLDFLVEYGMVAAVPLAAAGGLFLRHFRPSWTHAVVVGILVDCLANFPLCLPPIALIFVACWAHSMRSATMGACEMR